MRSVIHSQFGNPVDVLSIEQTAIPVPGPGQVRIRMSLATIHNHDLLTIAGQYGTRPELPAVAGTEATGVVDALGEGVSHIDVGQRVAASGKGTWSEFYLASAAACVPLPDQISDESGAQLISMPLSALTLLDFIAVEPGSWIVQNAANGAVGKALAMFARSRDVNVINLVRRDEAVTELADLGIGNVVSTSQTEWQETVRAIAGGAPIRAAIDGVGGTSAGDLLSCLGENGLVVSFGLMSGKPMQLSASDLIFKQAVVRGFWLAKIAPTLSPDKMKSLIGEIVRGVASGAVTLAVSGVYPLEDAAKAAGAAAEAGRRGKVLLRG